MKNKYIIIIAIIAVILTAVAVTILLTNNTGKPKEQNNTTTNTSAEQTAKKIEETIKNTQTVMLTTNGFEPNTLTVKKGTRIIWTNNSGENGSVNSDPYPTNSFWKFLNLGVFKDKENMSVTFETVGKFTYHNQLKPTQTGTVIVQ